MRKAYTLIEVLIVIAIILVVLVYPLSGLYLISERHTAEVVAATQKQGYMNVRVISKHFAFVSYRGCGDGDAALYRARATNSLGQDVELILCTGYFKGVTVRTE